MVFDERQPLLVSGRRSFVTALGRIVPLCLLVSGLPAYGVPTVLRANEISEPAGPTGPTSREVQIVLEASGELRLNADGKKINTLPLKVTGTLHYDERRLLGSDDSTSPIETLFARNYREARASIGVGDGESEVSLDAHRRLIIAHVSGARQELVSPLGPLTRDELELIDLQGSTAVLDRLLPTTPVAIGAEWPHDQVAVGLLTGLDVVTQSDLRSSCRQIEDQAAIVDLAGTVSGAVDGVASDIKVRAKYNIDLRSHQVTWLAMSLKENREIGHAAPGFDVTARIRVAVKDSPTCDELTDAALADLPLESTAGSTLLQHNSRAGGFKLLHSRQWRAMVDRSEVSILRSVESGNLIAQCNISSLPNLPAGERLQLEAFQADVKRALGDNFGQYVEATQSTNDSGLRVLRAVVTGVASELPVQWVYYHISNDQGRQAALVFTLDAKLVAQFAAADQALVSGFEFQTPSSAAPTPVKAKETIVPTALKKLSTQ